MDLIDFWICFDHRKRSDRIWSWLEVVKFECVRTWRIFLHFLTLEVIHLLFPNLHTNREHFFINSLQKCWAQVALHFLITAASHLACCKRFRDFLNILQICVILVYSAVHYANHCTYFLAHSLRDSLVVFLWCKILSEGFRELPHQRVYYARFCVHMFVSLLRNSALGATTFLFNSLQDIRSRVPIIKAIEFPFRI